MSEVGLLSVFSDQVHQGGGTLFSVLRKALAFEKVLQCI